MALDTATRRSRRAPLIGAVMRRPLLAVAMSIAALALPTTGVSATGPGGWDHIGTGVPATTSSLNGHVTALKASGSVLYVGGDFTNAGGVPNADRIAKWNGSAWSALGSGIGNGAVYAIAVAGGKVYAGGTFINAGGDPKADHLAVWNGTTWAHFCEATGPAFNGEVKALQVIGNRLYIGGGFSNGGGDPSADGILYCDLTTGAPTNVLPFGNPGYAVYALTADSNGILYAGGVFSDFAFVANADHVAAYDGATWSGLGADGAVTGTVRSLAASGTNVYVGTDGANVAGIAQADHVAKWNGSAWSAMGSNTAGADGWFTPTSYNIQALTALGSYVFAAGGFQNANGVATADDIAWFDGTAWHPIGSNGAGDGPLNGDGEAIATMAGKLYVGGSFGNAGGDSLADGAASYLMERPDARIGTSAAGPFIGNNIYSATAAGERKTISVARGAKGTFFVDVQNDGKLPDTLRLIGTGGATGFTVSYYSGLTNVTAAVLAGTFVTPTLAPGARFSLKVVVKLAATTASTATFLIKASSRPGVPVDAVKATVNAT
jgi:hypothetical protein